MQFSQLRVGRRTVAGRGVDGSVDLAGRERHDHRGIGLQISATSLPGRAAHLQVTNKDATAVSEVELLSGERIVGEKENLPPGFSGSFAVNVDAGKLHAVLPGRAATENTAVTVTGTGSRGDRRQHRRAARRRAPQDYAKYVTTQVGYLRRRPARRSTPRCTAPTLPRPRPPT